MTAEQTDLWASIVYTQNDSELALVGFADNQQNTNAYVLLQRTLHPSSDDILRRWDDIHIIVNDQKRSAYGGVKSITLFDNEKVLIELSANTALKLGTADAISVNITKAPVDASELAEALKLLCGNHVSFNRQIKGN